MTPPAPGRPILLLNLVRWLKTHKNVDVLMVAIDGGDLLDMFQGTGECLLWNIPLRQTNFAQKLFDRLMRTNNRQRHQKNMLEKMKLFRPDVVYFNSVGSCSLVPLVMEDLNHTPSLLHLHELEAIIQYFNAGQSFEKAIPFIDRWIAASDLVSNNLVERHHIPVKKIDRVYEYIDVSQWEREPAATHLTEGKFIIGSAGGVHWRKGYEFFILLGRELKKRKVIGDMELWWAGRVDEEHRTIIAEDLQKLDLLDHVKFIGISSEMELFYQQLDIFVVTSREDPYPVVALEAALFGMPILCWNRGTGTRELVEQGAGLTVDYLDIHAMADAVLELKDDPVKRKKMGEKARELAREHDVGLAGEMIYGILQKLIKN